MADHNGNKVIVTIQFKAPRGYLGQDVLVAEMYAWQGEGLESNETIVQRQERSITFQTYPASNLPELDASRRNLLITSSSRYNHLDGFLMLKLPIPTSGVSHYIRVDLSSSSLEAVPLLRFTAGLYTLIILDKERRYLHAVACDLREPAPSLEKVIVPYQAPPIGDRVFKLGFVAFQQTGYMNLNHQEVTRLQTRSFDEFLKILHIHNMRLVGSTCLVMGPEVLISGQAPAA